MSQISTKTFAITTCACITWVLVWSPLLHIGEVHTKEVTVKSVTCDPAFSKRDREEIGSYIHVNTGTESSFSTSIPKNLCKDILPLMKQGKSITITGPDSRFTDEISEWGVSFEGNTIKEFSNSKLISSKFPFFFLGLLPAMGIFLSSLYRWASESE